MHQVGEYRSVKISISFGYLVFLFQLCCISEVQAVTVLPDAHTGATHLMTTSEGPRLTTNGSFSPEEQGNSQSRVMGLSYSPNGHYLAVVTIDGGAGTHVAIWDLEANKVQTTISGLTQDFGNYPNVSLTWTPDGKYVTFGDGGGKRPIQFWDAMNGQLIKTLNADVVATSLVFSSDGTKALASPGGSGSSKVRVYDTASWEYTELDQGALRVQRLWWAPNGQILAIGYWTTTPPTPLESGGVNPINRHGGYKSNDSIARLIDPAGRISDRTKLLLASNPKTVQSNGKDFTYFQNQLSNNPFLISDIAGDTVAVSYGHILNSRSLQMLTYATGDVSGEQSLPVVVDQRNMAISPDGNYLYLKGDAPIGSDAAANNAIIDTRTGKLVLNFHGGHAGIAIRSDGKQLAIGNESTVELFDIH